MTDPRHALGLDAEAAVAAWLTDHGWEILDQRHRSPAGEIDLVALDGRGQLVAVEVRLRRSRSAGSATESVSPRHLRRLRAALAAYARDASVRHAGMRVDLVAVSPASESGIWQLDRLPGIDAW